MRGLRLTVLVLSVCILCAQGIHFVYYKYFYPHGSVLDDYVDQKIREAGSLEELLADYEIALEAVKQYEADHPVEEWPNYGARQSMEPFSSEIRLKRAIESWESRSREKSRLWYQWSAGLILFVIGAITIASRRWWLGVAVCIAGLGEMIWWSSPSMRLGGAVSEFERMLNTKLLLTVFTLVVVVLAWQVYEKHADKLEN